MTSSYSFPSTASSVPFFLHLDRTDSTNAVCRRMANLKDYSLVITTNQTSGRGRRDREWVSRPGEGIALTFVLPPQGKGRVVPDTWVPHIAGFAVVEALKVLNISGVGLKWPNDILVSGKKIGGVLCEKIATGQVLVGVGLNIGFQGQRPSPHAVGLTDHIEVNPGTPDLVVSGALSTLREGMTWSASLAHESVTGVTNTIGRKVRVEEPGGRIWLATAQGLDRSGHLVVVDESGTSHSLAASEVEHLFQ